MEEKGSSGDFMANERTFLAWVRTSIGIMAFGFVVVKFSIFVKQISLLISKEHPVHFNTHTGHSAILGIILVTVGAATLLFSYINYRLTEKKLKEGKYQHSSLFITLLTAAIFLISVFLITYLIATT